jgi:hypothetical protein
MIPQRQETIDPHFNRRLHPIRQSPLEKYGIIGPARSLKYTHLSPHPRVTRTCFDCRIRELGDVRRPRNDITIELENGLPASLGDVDKSYQDDIILLDAAGAADLPSWIPTLNLRDDLPHG